MTNPETITKYGIWSKKNNRLLKWDKKSNHGGDFCGEYEYTLEDTDDSLPDWLVDNPQHAEWVRLNSTDWYNASYNTPNHATCIQSGNRYTYGYSNNNYQVVKVEVITVITPEPITIPTIEEYFTKKYEGNPEELEWRLKSLKQHPDQSYSLYDLERINGSI